MSHLLKPAEQHDRHKAANVQAVGRGVEPAVQRHGPFGQALCKPLPIRAVRDQSAPFQFLDDAHKTARVMASWPLKVESRPLGQALGQQKTGQENLPGCKTI